MADYSLVKDQDNKAQGVWLKNADEANDYLFLMMLATRISTEDQSFSEEYVAAILGKQYRIVKNTHKTEGGCYVMFDGALAPGEQNGTSRPIPDSVGPEKKVTGNFGDRNSDTPSSKGWKIILVILVISCIAVVFYWILIKPKAKSVITESIAQVVSTLSNSTSFPSESAPIGQGQQNQVGRICWTYEFSLYDGNRSQVWETILSDETRKLLPFDQFKLDVVLNNPQLKEDGYVFFSQKDYVLPELCP